MTFSPHTFFLKNVLWVKIWKKFSQYLSRNEKQSILHDKVAALLSLHTVVLLFHFKCDTTFDLNQLQTHQKAMME